MTGTVRVGEADFGPAVGAAPVHGEVMPVAEQTAGVGEGCEAFNASNIRAVSGKLAFINLGICSAAIKAKNAQNAGAIAVIIGDTVAENAVQPIPLGGWDKTLTIPSVRIFLTDANKLRTSLAKRSRSASGVFASLGRAGGAQYAGADPLGRALMYAPNPFISGSSVSHFDRTMIPQSVNGTEHQQRPRHRADPAAGHDLQAVPGHWLVNLPRRLPGLEGEPLPNPTAS